MISDSPWAYCTEPGLNTNWGFGLSCTRGHFGDTHTHTRTHTHTHTKRDGKQIESKSVSIRGEYSRGESHFSLFWKDFYLSIQLFRERLSDKSLTVHATTPKGIVSCFSPWLLNRSISGKSEKMPLYRRGSVGLMNLFFLIWLLKNHWSYFIALSD